MISWLEQLQYTWQFMENVFNKNSEHAPLRMLDSKQNIPSSCFTSKKYKEKFNYCSMPIILV